MLAKAETSERRQKKLEHFFREAYALTFGLRPGERRRRSDASVDGEVVTVMRTSLTKSEFASALGMKHDAVFVRKMFNIVDKDGDGRISFQVGLLELRRRNQNEPISGIFGHRSVVLAGKNRRQVAHHF
jgi:dual oxidase